MFSPVQLIIEQEMKWAGQKILDHRMNIFGYVPVVCENCI